MKILVFLMLFAEITLFSQTNDSVFMNEVAREALTHKEVMKHLKYLCDSTPGRLLGSSNSLKAANYLKTQLENLQPDTCFLLNYETPAWQAIETKLTIQNGAKWQPLHALALGPSIATPKGGITADVIEVAHFNDISKLGKAKIEGKILFINQLMPQETFNPFTAYRDAIKIRLYGAPEGAKYGAIATIIRSLTQNTDTFPHTGKTVYVDSIKKIPIAALATQDADMLHELLQKQSSVRMNLKISSNMLEKVTTYNVIADFKGSEKPNDFILFGAHIDSWYNTQGAHDDGAGCVQVLELMRIFKKLAYNNKHSLRVVLFMDEELFQSGAAAYANYTKEKQVHHIAAIESDAGASAPRFIAVDAGDSVIININKHLDIFKPYVFTGFVKGGTDVDIDPLKAFGVPLFGNKPYNQQYFNFHHSAYDSFEKVNFRDLQCNTINIAGLIYLIDNYELK